MFNFQCLNTVFLTAFVLGIGIFIPGAAYSASSPQIDFKLIYHAAQLADQAYDGKSEIIGKHPGKSAWVSTPGQTFVQYVLIQNHKRKIQVIAVRGSYNKANWKLDADTRGVLDKKAGIKIHAGFLRAAKTIYVDVEPRLKRNYVTYLTGHSLGGAVASILGIYITIDKFKIEGIYTFGQPRFTDLAGATKYESLPVLRAIYQNDVVSLLPNEIEASEQKYAHIGASINLLSGPYYAYVSAERALRITPGLLGRFASRISAPDHKMKWYLSSLKEKLEGAKQVNFKDRDKYIIRHQAGKQKGTPIKRQFNFNKSN
jgi:triacylglycerol lipase